MDDVWSLQVQHYVCDRENRDPPQQMPVNRFRLFAERFRIAIWSQHFEPTKLEGNQRGYLIENYEARRQEPDLAPKNSIRIPLPMSVWLTGGSLFGLYRLSLFDLGIPLFLARSLGPFQAVLTIP